MTEPPIRYGPNTPFRPEEREVIEQVHLRLAATGGAAAEEAALTVRRQMVCLEWLGEVLSEYPSPLTEQSLGERHRGLQTLIEALTATNPASFEFHLPTRAFLGRALVMAETNFYRLLLHICRDVFRDDAGRAQAEKVAARMREGLYTKLAEEVLTSLAADNTLARDIRGKAVVALAHIWERRLNYRVADFFPVLEATWEARQRISVSGVELNETQEIFALLQAGCDAQFIDYFTQANPSEDEVEAFREFLFGTTAEELDRLAAEMAAGGQGCARLRDTLAVGERDAAMVFYEFFRSRNLLSFARRLARLPGPKRTAEAYVMINFLQRIA